MSFISILKTIGTDIEKGLTIAAPILQFFPSVETKVAPIFSDIAEVISVLEEGLPSGTTPDAATMSSLVQAVSTASAVKNASATAKAAVTKTSS